MNKKHILLIENGPDELAFFTDALEKSQLSFLCSTARSSEQATRILKNLVPDIIFLDVSLVTSEDIEFLSRMKRNQKVPVIMYSISPQEQHENDKANYLQLTRCVQTMANLLQHLLLN